MQTATERKLYTYMETSDALSKLRLAACGLTPPLSHEESMELWEIVNWPFIGAIGTGHYAPTLEASDAS